MSICDDCQVFQGHHTHNAPFHSAACECDGTDKSRRPVVDPAVMLSIRLEALTQEGVEIGDPENPGRYAGKDVLPWHAITRRLKELWND